MKLTNDMQITTDAEKRASFRLLGVTTKLNPREVEDVERLARSRGLQRGELIRKLILDELARDAGSVEASTELTEIVGIRLMLTNLFRPLATGQKLTPEAFDNMLAEVKKRKREVATDEMQDLERA
ncbi:MULTISPECIES: CopG family transcriptional regulator [Acidobacteriaceae]|uniref:ribbon-helix-helix domain-containing protein n=1 Tax=Acidobacteriaceae TaxID=204434 RepID=UPI00131AA060|nr:MULTISPECIES: CopG family transcriptional regulator [Acidobacteriaceae]MDW5266676.1 CopG family transcriptional regulator [Edaphobacter sp.]